jgi:hypothetical protein
VAWSPSLFADRAEPISRWAEVVRGSAPEAKVALFRSLFVGREDVYALRWENERTGKAGWGPAVRGGWRNARRPDREHLPLTDDVVGRHLAGEIHAGLYPLMRGDACRLLACDFDGPGWVLDARSYVDAARSAGIDAALERSRSGDGGHVWMFFAGPVRAASATPRRCPRAAGGCSRNGCVSSGSDAVLVQLGVDALHPHGPLVDQALVEPGAFAPIQHRFWWDPRLG